MPQKTHPHGLPHLNVAGALRLKKVHPNDLPHLLDAVNSDGTINLQKILEGQQQWLAAIKAGEYGLLLAREVAADAQTDVAVLVRKKGGENRVDLTVLESGIAAWTPKLLDGDYVITEVEEHDLGDDTDLLVMVRHHAAAENDAAEGA